MNAKSIASGLRNMVDDIENLGAGPLTVDVALLKDAITALTSPEGLDPMDKGPWTIYQDGSSVVSDDFTHDVLLRISGDFCAETRQKYAEWLVSVLNAARMEVRND